MWEVFDIDEQDSDDDLFCVVHYEFIPGIIFFFFFNFIFISDFFTVE